MISIETQELAEKANSWPFVEARNLRDRLIKFNSFEKSTYNFKRISSRD